MGKRTYTGDDTGLDMSWQSYLADTWKNKNIDPPPPDQSGETVGGTTDDDLHDERTSLLPEHVKQESLTALQLAILRTAATNFDATAAEIAVVADASRSWVVATITDYLPEHSAAEHSPTSPHPKQTQIDEFPSRK